MALNAGGRTIAVLACGLDIIYPSDNLNLAKRIVESGQGALITEFPLGVKPWLGTFPSALTSSPLRGSRFQMKYALPDNVEHTSHW